MKNLFKSLAGFGVLTIAVGVVTWSSRAGQDWLFERAVTAAMNRPSPFGEFDGHV